MAPPRRPINPIEKKEIWLPFWKEPGESFIGRKTSKVKTSQVVFQFLIVKMNEHEIPELFSLAKSLGVDEVKIKTAQLYDYKNGNALMPDNIRYSRYQKNPDGTYRLKHKILNQCWKMWHSAVITWNGLVVPCCFDKDALFEMGQLRKQTFHDIWKGPQYELFRKQILQQRKQIEICTNCTEGCTIWA